MEHGAAMLMLQSRAPVHSGFGSTRKDAITNMAL